MEKKWKFLINCVLFLFFLALLIYYFYPNIIGTFYKQQYKSQLYSFKSCISLIKDDRFSKTIGKYLAEGSKLHDPQVREILSDKFKKIDIETLQIVRVEKMPQKNGVAILQMEVFFNSNRKSMIMAGLEKRAADNFWKVNHIFISDHYFDDL